MAGAGAPASTLTFVPSDDAYVRSAAPAANYGSETTLRVYTNGTAQTQSFLKFAVAGLTGSASAKLRLFVTDASPASMTLSRVGDTSWSEQSATWSTRPALGAALATGIARPKGTWVELDAGTLPGNGTYAFGLSGGLKDAVYSGSGETATPPQLVVTPSGPPPANTPPAAVDDAYTTPSGTALSVAAPGLLGNDSDADGDVVTAAKVADPAHGTLAVNGDGGFTYTPEAGFTGADSFTYRASDGTDTSAVAQVQVTVAGGSGGESATFAPTDDSFVRSSFPSENNGSAPTLRAYLKSGAETRSYLTFTVSGLSGPLPAKLRLYVTDASNVGGSVYRSAATGWSEGSITWANQPGTSGASLGALGAAAVGRWVEVGVGSVGNGTHSFVVAGGSSNAVWYASSETTNAPQLVVGSGGPPTGTGPANAALPTMSAMAPERGTAYAQPGTWTGTAPIAYAYRWLRCSAAGGNCAPVPGAIAQSFRLEPGDVGSTLRVEVTATNADGSATASSAVSAPVPARPGPPAGDPVIAAVGDIACSPDDGSYKGGAGTASACRQKATSDLVADSGLAAVLLAGDEQYEHGEYANFLKAFDPTWGRVNGISYPAPGNHEYETSGAAGYYQYFGAAAGDSKKGYYSFDVGTWHIVALNSNCSAVTCSAGSAQEQWLRADLAAHRATCTLAFWHHPRYTSATSGATAAVQPLWKALADFGADVVVTGHVHNYERFAPQAPDGSRDDAGGIREFIVGSGGVEHRGFGTVKPNSQARSGNTFGVLELTLHPAAYDWRFVAEPGSAFTDSGSTACH